MNSTLYFKNIIQNEEDAARLFDAEVLTRFLPAFTMLISEDLIRLELQKASNEIQGEFTSKKLVNEIPDGVLDFLRFCFAISL